MSSKLNMIELMRDLESKPEGHTPTSASPRRAPLPASEARSPGEAFFMDPQKVVGDVFAKLWHSGAVYRIAATVRG